MTIRIALCSIDPTVGALDLNAAKILAAYEKAAAEGADIVLTPEMALTGYPLEDLTQKPAFLLDVARAREALCHAVRATGREAALVFGHPTDTGRDDGNRRLVYNSATFIDPTMEGEQIRHKRELPNYGVFDEKRNYLEGPAPRVVNFRGLRIGLLICEDGWFEGVTKSLASQGADMLLWINGSPFSEGKNVLRRRHATNRISYARVPIAYVNLVGGQDELVFDGDCFAFDGRAFYESPLFRESSHIVEFDVVRQQNAKRGGLMPALPEVEPTSVAAIYDAIVAGLAGYLGKSRFSKVVLGYSGGVDSGLVAAVAADALGPENTLLVRLPSKYSSDGSKDDAWTGAQRLGCPLRTISIEPIVEMSRQLYAGMTFDMNEQAPNSVPVLTGVADENIQARARGNVLMSISNQEGYMLLTTTNRSEGICGYGTLNGDLAGGYAPLKDVLKTLVWDLCRYRNSLDTDDIARLGYKGPVAEVVPEEIISKPPSAELRPDQQDTDSLPPYPVLDAIIVSLVDKERSVKQTVGAGIADVATVMRIQNLIYNAEYKRRLGAPGIKIGDKLLGRDRRYPIVNGYRDDGID